MYQRSICILIHVNADCALGHWYIDMLQKMQHPKDSIYYELIFRRHTKLVLPMSQCTIGRWYIKKNALLYHIKLMRNLCDSILYTKYLERHLYRVK